MSKAAPLLFEPSKVAFVRTMVCPAWNHINKVLLIILQRYRKLHRNHSAQLLLPDH